MTQLQAIFILDPPAGHPNAPADIHRVFELTGTVSVLNLATNEAVVERRAADGRHSHIQPSE